MSKIFSKEQKQKIKVAIADETRIAEDRLEVLFDKVTANLADGKATIAYAYHRGEKIKIYCFPLIPNLTITINA